ALIRGLRIPDPQGDLTKAKEHLKYIERQIKQAEKDLERSKKALTDVNDQILQFQNLQTSLDALKKALADIDKQISQSENTKANLDTLKKQLADVDKQIKELEKLLDGALGSKDTLNKEWFAAYRDSFFKYLEENPSIATQYISQRAFAEHLIKMFTSGDDYSKLKLRWVLEVNFKNTYEFLTSDTVQKDANGPALVRWFFAQIESNIQIERIAKAFPSDWISNPEIAKAFSGNKQDKEWFTNFMLNFFNYLENNPQIAIRYLEQEPFAQHLIEKADTFTLWSILSKDPKKAGGFIDKYHAEFQDKNSNNQKDEDELSLAEWFWNRLMLEINLNRLTAEEITEFLPPEIVDRDWFAKYRPEFFKYLEGRPKMATKYI
ncbi:MAG: hypothetical protein AAB267_09245, partial [Candidatus Desantisbacteria bacterium]